MSTASIDADIDALRRFRRLRSPSIYDEGEAYAVYHRYGFLDPRYDSIEDAIEALSLHRYERDTIHAYETL